MSALILVQEVAVMPPSKLNMLTDRVLHAKLTYLWSKMDRQSLVFQWSCCVASSTRSAFARGVLAVPKAAKAAKAPAGAAVATVAVGARCNLRHRLSCLNI